MTGGAQGFRHGRVGAFLRAVRVLAIFIIVLRITAGWAMPATFNLPVVPRYAIEIPPEPPLKLGQKITPEPPSPRDHQPRGNNTTPNDARGAGQSAPAIGPGIQDAPVVQPEAEGISHAKGGQEQSAGHGLILLVTSFSKGLFDFISTQHDLVNAVAAIFVALFTGTLWWSSRTQGMLLGRSVKAAQDSADAALLQAKIIAASALDFAFDLVQAPADATDLGSVTRVAPGRPPDVSYVVIELTNVGNNVVRLTQLDFDWAVKGALPEDPIYHRGIPSLNFSLRPDQTFKHIFANARVALGDKHRALLSDGASLWVFGFVTYEDFLRDVYDFGFAAFWEAGRPGLGRELPRGFVTMGAPPAYNYKTKRQPDQPKSGPPPKPAAMS